MLSTINEIHVVASFNMKPELICLIEMYIFKCKPNPTKWHGAKPS